MLSDAAASDLMRADAGADRDTSAPGDGSPGGGPIFLSFGTNVTSLTEGESVTFVAILTDPDGIEDLIGGALKNPGGTISYGAFATSSTEGAYALTLSWGQLVQTEDMHGVQATSRDFLAEFYDAAGHKVSATATVQLTCGSKTACHGVCFDLQTDPDNCGTCGNACDGCAMGSCFNWTACTALDMTTANCDAYCAKMGSVCSNTGCSGLVTGGTIRLGTDCVAYYGTFLCSQGSHGWTVMCCCEE